MADITLNEQGDLDISNNTLSLTTAETQRLRIRMLTILGEWFLDTTIGIPYFQNPILKASSKAAVDMIFRTHLTRSDVVQKVLTFNSQLNRSTRFYSYESEVQMTSGETINIKDGVIS